MDFVVELINKIKCILKGNNLIIYCIYIDRVIDCELSIIEVVIFVYKYGWNYILYKCVLINDYFEYWYVIN